MSACVRAFIWTFHVICGYSAASALLQSPTDVRLTSYNMNLVLRWKPPDEASDGLLYTAQYKSPISEYRTACENVTALECDLTLFDLSLYGKYRARVRGQRGAESSAWIESKAVTQDKETTIGPPAVSLFPTGASLEVSIKDPKFRISTLRNVFSGATYNISYWKKEQREEVRSKSDIMQSRVVLSDLEPWSQYCVRVQIITPIGLSEPSGITCESTAGTPATPWLPALLAVLGLAFVVGLVVAVVMNWGRISKLLCPKDALPEYLKDYLLAPPASTVYPAMQDSNPLEEIYDQVTIIAENKSIEGGGAPPEPAEDKCRKEPEGGGDK